MVGWESPTRDTTSRTRSRETSGLVLAVAIRSPVISRNQPERGGTRSPLGGRNPAHSRVCEPLAVVGWWMDPERHPPRLLRYANRVRDALVEDADELVHLPAPRLFAHGLLPAGALPAKVRDGQIHRRPCSLF